MGCMQGGSPVILTFSIDHETCFTVLRKPNVSRNPKFVGVRDNYNRRVACHPAVVQEAILLANADGRLLEHRA